MVGHWTFDGSTIAKSGAGTITALDGSGQNNNGTVTNGPVTASGKHGQALQFDGVNDRVTIGDPASGILDFGTNSFSYGLWVYVSNSAGNFDMPWWKGGATVATAGYDMELGNSTWDLGLTDGDERVQGIFSSSPIFHRWVHLYAVVNRDLGVVLAYRDGVQVDSDSIATLGSVSTTALATVSGDSSGAFPFKGSIDDVRVYNRALTPSEVKRLYNQGASQLNISQPARGVGSLVGYWSFNGPDMARSQKIVTFDKSGNGNNGYVRLATTTPTTSGKIGQGLGFDGVDDTVALGDARPVTSDYSISVWFKLDSFPSDMYSIFHKLVAGQNSIAFGIWSTKSIRHVFRDATNEYSHYSTQSVPVGVWTHAVGTRRGATTEIYINGVLDSRESDGGTGAISYDTSGLYFGSQNGTARFFDGIIDEVRVYDRALSLSEIKRLYNMGS